MSLCPKGTFWQAPVKPFSLKRVMGRLLPWP